MNTFIRAILCTALFAFIVVRPGQTNVTATLDDGVSQDEPSSTDTAETTRLEHGFTANIDAAIAASTHTRPAMIVFTADWSDPSNTFEQTILTDDEVRQAIRDCVIPARVDLTDRDDDAAYAIARRFDIRAVPTVLLVNPHGQVLDAATGLYPPQQFARWINPELPAAVAAE